ncbi:PHP domain-containing protein, partial [Streptomyces huiliensis]|uniref:PHP domain-containing protein n=1 Tax=Streptomyces huiliensis TaxID=2876027 RepID=UPI001CBE5D41
MTARSAFPSEPTRPGSSRVFPEFPARPAAVPARPAGPRRAAGAFTHLHTASGFSARYGASHPERLAERAAERGMDALALTDRDTLAGAVRFARATAAAGVRPLFGVDLAVRGPEPAPGETVRRRTPVRGGAFVDESAPRAVFLARD